MSNVAIILAAGESRRLGRPKQLLRYHGETLVGNAVHNARDAGCTDILVVVGAKRELVSSAVAKYDCHVVENEQWRVGLGSSLAAGVQALTNRIQGVSRLLLLLCDQPIVDVAHLRELVTQSELTDQIAATEYPDDSAGVPAVFPSRYLTRLGNLTGDVGAKSILAAEPTCLVRCESAAFDIDHPDHLIRLNRDT